MKMTNGELANLRDAAFERKDYGLMVQVESEITHRSDLSVINHKVLNANRTHLYQCPICRRCSVCFSQSILAQCRDRGYCTDCRDSDCIQLRYRIALLDQALRCDVTDWDDALPGPVPLMVRAQHDPAMAPHYRALYKRCKAKRGAWRALLEVTT
jgi:hypothetical protein